MFIWCNAQDFYVRDFAGTSLDNRYDKAVEYYSSSKLDSAKLVFDQLALEWAEINATNSNAGSLQNWYYVRAKQFQISRRMGELTLKSIDEFIALESNYIRDLSSNNLVLGFYYSTIAKAKISVLGELDESIVYSNRAISIYEHNGIDCLDLIGRELIEMGYAYRSMADYQKAEEYFIKSIAIKKKVLPFDLVSMLYSKYALAAVYLDQMKLSEALEINLEVAKDALTVVDKSHRLNYNTLDAIAIIYGQQGKIAESLEYNLASLEAMRGNPVWSSSKMYKRYRGISNNYKLLGEFDLASKYIDSSFNLVKNTDDNSGIASVYNAKALLSVNSKDELHNLKQAISHCEKDSWCAQVNLPIFLTNIGVHYSKNGDSQAALNYYLKSKEAKELNISKTGFSLPNTYQLLAVSYADIGLNDKADLYYNKAITTTLKYRGDDNYYVADQYNAYGKFLLEVDELAKAADYLSKAHDILSSETSQSILTSHNNNLYLSKLYQKQERYDKSLHHAMLAYQGSGDFYTANKVSSIEQLFLVNKVLGKLDSCEVLLSELASISEYDLNESDSTHHRPIILENPWITYNSFFTYLKLEGELDDNHDELYQKVKYGISLTNLLKEKYFFETSEKKLQSNLREFFNWAIDRLGTQYMSTGNQEYLSLLYECMERSKSLLLERQSNKEFHMLKKGVPQRIIDEEEGIIFSYEKSYDKLINQSQTSDSITDVDLRKIYQIQKRQESFLDSIKINYPEYYSSRYIHDIVPLSECQQMASIDKRVFHFYHWGDSIIHHLIINRTVTHYEQIPISEVEPKLISLQSILSTPISEVPEIEFEKQRGEFILLSRDLYQALIGSDSLSSDLITIIPDNRLVHLPFEILLSSEIDSTVGFRSLPYLFRHVQINYSGSMSNVKSLSEYIGYQFESEYVGFAPSLEFSASVDSLELNDTRGGNFNIPLLYNGVEILKSHQLFEGDYFIGNSATEGVFKQTAPNSSILHLAMHTKVINHKPFESYLQFQPNDDTQDNGQLHLDEISQLDLNSNLVVLSACETNIGENIIGESILGIARAFQLAACHNIVLTNWLIDDKSSSQIIPSFLSGIQSGQSPPEALQRSKLEYLSSCSEIQTHPYYWSGYSYYGAIEINTPKQYLAQIISIGLGVLLCLFIAFRVFSS